MIDTLISWLQDQQAIGQVNSNKALKGGYWNAVYRLQGAGFDLVLKQFADTPEGGLFPTIADAEARALEQLSGLGIAPDFHSFWPQAPGGAVLLYKFVPGQMWQGDTDVSGRLFQQLHQAEVAGPYRQLPMTPEALLQQADALYADYRDTEWGQKLIALRPTLVEVPAIAPVLVHTDCGPGNIIQDGKYQVFIDFQCPGLGDPCEDLTCFLSPGIFYLYGLSALSEADEKQFLAAYDNAAVVQRLQTMRAYYSYRLAAYYIMRHYSQQGIDEAVSAAYGGALSLEIKALESYL